MNKELKQAGEKLAAERGLAYVILPLHGDDEPYLLIPQGQDLSEYEFRRQRLTAETLRKVAKQCLKRISLVDDAMKSLIFHDFYLWRVRGIHKQKSLFGYQTAIEMALAFLAEMPDDQQLEFGEDSVGAHWGDGVLLLLKTTKGAEAQIQGTFWTILRAAAAETSPAPEDERRELWADCRAKLQLIATELAAPYLANDE